MNTALILLCILLLIALNIVPPIVSADYKQKHGKPLLAPLWSVWHLLYAGEAIACLTLLGYCFYFAGLDVVAKPLGISMQVIRAAAAKNDISTTQAILYYFAPMTVIQDAVFFLVPAIIISALYRVPLRKIGLPTLPPRRAVIAGLLLGVAFLAVASGLQTGLEEIAKHYHHIPFVARMLHVEETNPVGQMVATLKKAGPLGFIVGVLMIGVAAPIGEEMVFRGFALNILAKRFGGWVGIIVSALLFAAPHSYSLIGQSVIFLMGLGLGYVYRNSGSLWTTIIIHAVNNTGAILFAYFG